MGDVAAQDFIYIIPGGGGETEEEQERGLPE